MSYVVFWGFWILSAIVAISLLAIIFSKHPAVAAGIGLVALGVTIGGHFTALQFEWREISFLEFVEVYYKIEIFVFSLIGGIILISKK